MNSTKFQIETASFTSLEILLTSQYLLHCFQYSLNLDPRKRRW